MNAGFRPRTKVGGYVLPFARGNFCGPVLLGRLFDMLGRRIMIRSTYLISGVLLSVSGYLFQQELIDVTQQPLASFNCEPSAC